MSRECFQETYTLQELSEIIGSHLGGNEASSYEVEYNYDDEGEIEDIKSITFRTKRRDSF